ncbi:hypothetical protein K445DRAFT_373213 [Daldinia sp. EC12]|nr:hypothetical protein K445DRAFT_373213 [Daldinia sp. EC12]
MPAFPAFDCYATLEVARTATQQDITVAYRRLALIHHPDKNPHDAEAATATFQRIQSAYETLHDPANRARYDSDLSSRTTATPSRPEYQARADSPLWYDSDSDDEEEEERVWTFEDIIRILNLNLGRQYRGPESYNRDSAFRQAERAERERVMEEIRKQKEAEAAQKKARQDDKRSKEEMRVKQKEAERIAEKSNQEIRWEKLKAVTNDEKLKACLHSAFCSKTQQPKKFKCGACQLKRGIIAFECPHCSLHICQQCVFEFAKKRSRATMQNDPKSEAESNSTTQREASTQTNDDSRNQGPNGKSKSSKSHKNRQ